MRNFQALLNNSHSINKLRHNSSNRQTIFNHNLSSSLTDSNLSNNKTGSSHSNRTITLGLNSSSKRVFSHSNRHHSFSHSNRHHSFSYNSNSHHNFNRNSLNRVLRKHLKLNKMGFSVCCVSKLKSWLFNNVLRHCNPSNNLKPSSSLSTRPSSSLSLFNNHNHSLFKTQIFLRFLACNNTRLNLLNILLLSCSIMLISHNKSASHSNLASRLNLANRSKLVKHRTKFQD